MSQRFKVYDGAFPHFITCTVVYWIPVFCREDYFRILLDSMIYCVKEKGLYIHGYVLMPNHMHMICSQVDGKIPDAIRDMKRHTSTLVAQKLEEDGRTVWLQAFTNAGEGKPKVWTDGYHPMQIHSSTFFDQKIGYMHNNPIRAGFVANPEDWVYSSAGYYYCDRESHIPITALDW